MVVMEDGSIFEKSNVSHVVIAIIIVVCLTVGWMFGYYSGRIDERALAEPETIVAVEECDKAHATDPEVQEAIGWTRELEAEAYESGYDDAFTSEWMEQRLAEEFQRGVQSVK